MNKTRVGMPQRETVTCPMDAVAAWGHRFKGTKYISMAIVFAVGVILTQAAMAAGPGPVNLRTADNFTILAGAAITSGPGTINGDVGLSPTTASFIGVTDAQVNGTIYAVDAGGPAGAVVDPALLTVAKNDLTTAYNDAAARTPADMVDPGAGNIGGSNLSPGLYKFTSTAFITGADVTLTGGPDDVWIFQVGSDLQVGVGIKVVLAGGARAKNIFWQVGTSATLGTSSVFKGSIMADQSITMNASSSIEGRTLARIAAVTFSGADCSLPPNVITASASANGSITPSGTVSLAYHGNQIFTITPDVNCHVVDVLVDGSSVGAVTTHTFTDVTTDHTITATFAIDTFTLTYTAGPDGSIVGTSPQTVNHGASGALVTATPSANHHFVKWSDDVMTAARTDANVVADIAVTATFAIDTFTLTYTAGPDGSIGGTSPQTVNHAESGTLVTATPSANYHFVKWSDDVMTAARTDANVMADIAVTATFAIDTFTLTYTAGPDGSIVGTSPQTVNHAASGSLVTATPSTNHHFVKWSDDVMTAARTDANVVADIAVTATFAIDTFTLTYTAGPDGSIVGTSPQTVNHAESGTLVTATPSANHHFVKWSDDVMTAARTDANVVADIAVTATFAIDTFTLTYTAGPDGSIVGTSPQTVNHAESGTLVTATPSANHHFVKWSDDVMTAARTDANVVADIAVTATFAIDTFTLTYTAGPDGSIVGTTPQTVNHAESGTLVTATPSANHHFVKWSDDVMTAARTDANVMADIAVTATFAIDTFTLTYTAGPDGSIIGTSPQTVNHGASGSLVTATPSANHHFVKWSDDVMTAARTDANVVADIAVTATFAIDTFTLTYTAGPDGSIGGTSPQTVNHGASGSLVTATPSANHHFVKWSDDVMTAARTDANVVADIAVTATFAIDTFTLTYTAGSDGSIVGTSPQTVDHGASGSLVTATPSANHHFVKWSDDVMTAVRTDANVVANIAVTATFAIDTFTLTYTAGPDGSIVGTSPQTVNHGASGSLVTATPSANHHFVKWSDDVMTAARTDANVVADIAVTATFAIDTFTLTYTAGSDGSIVGTSPQTVNHAESGTLVTATPSANHHFVKWSDDVMTAARTDANVVADIAVTATFAIDTFTLTYTAGPDGSIVGTTPQTVNHGASGSLVTATPSANHHFVKWSDDVMTAARTDANVVADIAVTATFAIDTFTLTYTAGSDGSIAGTSPQTVNHGASGSLVTATPSANYHFVKWSDDVMTEARTDTNVVADIAVTATFAIDTFTLTYTAGPDGSIGGTSPQTVNHGASGALVTATPSANYHFVKWSDDVMTAARTDANVVADIAVTATFAIDTFTLTYTAGPDGSIVGTSPQTVNHGASGALVTATPSANHHFVKWSDDVMTAARTDANVVADIAVTATFAIDTFTLTYTAGSDGSIVGTSPQTVNHGASGALVTATPSANHHFVKWSDDVMTAARTDANVVADIAVTATFAIDTFTLTYTAGPDGSIVGTSPQTVNHGASGALVTATPSANYHFVKWSDDVMTAVRTDANVVADIAVTATFAIDTFTLTYTAGPDGSIVGTSPQTVNHGASGALVTATPSTNHHFVKWSDDVMTAVRTDANVVADIAVTATFAIDTFTLTYTAEPDGSIVGTSPQTVNHGASGALVTATPSANHHFVKWSDDVMTAVRTDANVVADIAVTATFAIDTFTLTYTAGPDGSIIGTSPQTVNHGASGSLVTATPSANHHFVKWSDDVMTAARTDANVVADIAVTATFAIDTFTLTYTAGPDGSIGGTSPQTVNHGASGSLVTATPSANYHFVKWSDDVMTAARTDANVVADIAVTATFAIDTFTLTYTAGSDGSIVGTSPQTVNHAASGSLVTATPSANYHFVKWSDDVMTAARTDANVVADIAVTATFAIDTFTLTYTAGPDGSIGGTSPQTVNHAESGTLVTATPSANHHFVKWSDDVMTAARTDANVVADIAVTATFAIDTFTLTYTSGPDGSIVGTSPQTVNHGASGSLVTATPSANHHFVKWSDDVMTAVRTDANVVANIAVTATFAIDTFTLTYTAGPDGSIVGTSPQTVNHGASGALVTATPSANHHFVKWSDDVMTAARTDANVVADIAVTATFAIDTFTLTYTAGPDGSIGGTSPQTVNHGASGSLVTATPSANHHFVKWSDDVMTAARTDANVVADIAVTATFAIDTFTLTYTAGSDGSIAGTSPQTVNHGASGSLVTATPSANYHFVKWSDDVMTAARTDANVVADIAVTATFAIDTFTLTYTAGSDGSIVGTSPQTVDHGASGSLVTATPSANHHFVKWSDDVMTAARTDTNVVANIAVTATFAIDTFTLTYTAGPDGSIGGTSPQTVDHGASGSLVTATPSANYHFVKWSDDVMTAARTDANVVADIAVTATFAIDTFTLTYTAGPDGSIAGTSPQTVNHGASGSLVTATPSANHHFVKWSDDVMTAARTDANVVADIAVTATFAIDTFTLTYTAGPDGSIAGTSPQTVNHAASGSLVTATPSANHHFVKWSDDVMTAARTDANVVADIAVTATFAIDTFTLTSSNGANGSITPSSTVNYGTDTTFFVTPDINYDVVDVLVDGVSVGAVTSYDFTNVTASHTISTTFAIGEPLENGVSILGIGGDEGSVRIFKVTLPAGQTLLTVETTAGFSGDCDLYIRRGEMPTLSDYDAKSATEGNAELITIHDPESGNWYVMLNAYKDFSGVTLVVTYTADAPAKVLSLDATQGAYADKISLTWAGVSGATKYEVWRSDVNNVELAVNIAAVEAPAVSYEDMLPAKSSFKCYYWVRALNASYTGGFSDYAYGTTIADNSVVDLRNGVAKTGISGSIGSMRTFRLNVPAGQAVLDITVSGGTGDCDINVGLGETGSRRYSIRSTTSENIQYANPVDGNYYINIYGKTAYTDVKLMAKYMLGSPVAPTRLAATQGTFSDRIVLTWTASCGATSYDVYRALKVGTAVPKFADAVKIATVAGTEYEDTDVVFGAGDATNIYYYWLKAVNSAGSSKETAAVKGHIMPLPLAAGTLAASDGTYFDKVRVTWGRKTNVTSYEVYRTEGPLFAGETLVGGVDASSLASYVFDDFNVPLNTLPATKYYYWIKAINSDNDKSVLSIRPNSGYVSNRGPSKVIATKGTLADGKIIVTWTAVSGATSYDVYKDSEAPENVPSATYEDMPGDTNSHTFAIKAIYGGYESAFSPVASGYAGDAPSTLGAPVLKSASTNLYEYVLITWGAVAKAKAYRIYRSGTNVFPNDGGIADVIDSLTYEDHVGAGVKYYYWVTAVIDTVESKPSASKTGMAAAVLADSFADPADYPDGQMIAVAGADKGSCTYYSIVVPAGTTRLVATLSGAATAGDDCDMYAKLGCYPTTASYNAKGVENRTDGTDEILAVKNPAAGTWYFMLYGAGISGYTGRDLTVACYSAANIYLTVVPANDMNPPFRATFKGVVVDASGKGIPGLAIMARSPITGLSSYLIKTNASGVFTYSDLISTEGEHTYDFFFTDMPDTGTASHTVFTKNTSLKTADFDFSAYLKAAPVALTGAPDDLAGMKAFLNTSNGWDDAAVSATYTRMWIDETIGKVQSDDALLGKLDGGLYMVFYGVEGAGAGNGTDAVSGVPVSGLSPVPFVVHVTTSKKDTVLGNLLDMGIIDASTKAGIDLGRTGVIAIASLDSADANKDISLRAYEQLNLLSSITDKDMSVVFVEDGKYSDVLTRKFTVTIGDRQINVITSAFAAITQEE